MLTSNFTCDPKIYSEIKCCSLHIENKALTLNYRYDNLLHPSSKRPVCQSAVCFHTIFEVDTVSSGRCFSQQSTEIFYAAQEAGGDMY
jgi:hypothetical protein